MDPFAQGTADILEELGVSAVFKPDGGNPVETRVIKDHEVELAGGHVTVAEDMIVLTCLRADVGIPAPDDVFTIDDTDHPVDHLPEDEAGDEHLIRVIVR